MFLADFHVHTNRSDGRINLPDVIDLFGSHGFGAVAITDHLCENTTVLGKASRYLGCSLTERNFGQYMEELRREADRARRRYNMLVIPGFEITRNTVSNQRSAHYLALGIEEYVDPNLPIEEACRRIRELGGLAIAAHPVSTRKLEKQTYHLWDRRDELRECFDAWEVASGPHLFDEVLHSGLPMIASSDLHHARQISSWKSVLRCERTVPAVLDAIRRQDLSFAFYSAPARAPSLLSAFSPVRRV